MSDKLKRIHDASIHILEKVGVKLYHSEVLELIAQKGVKVKGETAFFKEDQVMEWVGKAPPNFTQYARNPKYNMLVGGNHVEYAAGYGCPAIIEHDGTKRQARLGDYIKFLKLVHQSSYFNINGGILVQPSDVEVAFSISAMVYSTIIYSDKCIMGIPGEAAHVQRIMDMAGIVCGGMDLLQEKPMVMTLINTLSPLQMDKAALDSLLICARYNQPLTISPAPMAGTTGPVCLAGNIAMGNAEALAGIAVAQMIREGMPVIYGLMGTNSDLRTGSITHGPGHVLHALYSKRLADMYGLPSRTGGANSDAREVSVQSGYESMLSMFSACQNKVNLIIHSAGILDGFSAMSFEQFVVDLEILSMIEYTLKDIKTDEDSLALEVIAKVAPGGEFLTTAHTLERCRTEHWLSEISFRGALENIEARDIIFENIQKKQQAMLEGYQKPDLNPVIRAKLDDYLIEAGADGELIETINTSG